MRFVQCLSIRLWSIPRVRPKQNRIRRPPILKAQIGHFRVSRYRISTTRIFSESQTSPTTTKKRTSGPPMSPPKPPIEGGGGGGGGGGNIARNLALNVGFLGLFFILDSTGGGGIFDGNGGGEFRGGGGGGNNGDGNGGGSNVPQEPQYKMRELGNSSDDEDYNQSKHLKRKTLKSCKRQKEEVPVS
eukprot:g2062.t1